MYIQNPQSLAEVVMYEFENLEDRAQVVVTIESPTLARITVIQDGEIEVDGHPVSFLNGEWWPQP